MSLHLFSALSVLHQRLHNRALLVPSYSISHKPHPVHAMPHIWHSRFIDHFINTGHNFTYMSSILINLYPCIHFHLPATHSKSFKTLNSFKHMSSFVIFHICFNPYGHHQVYSNSLVKFLQFYTLLQPLWIYFPNLMI
jgi:hypothetical protein